MYFSSTHLPCIAFFLFNFFFHCSHVNCQYLAFLGTKQYIRLYFLLMFLTCVCLAIFAKSSCQLFPVCEFKAFFFFLFLLQEKCEIGDIFKVSLSSALMEKLLHGNTTRVHLAFTSRKFWLS